jgi:hypothetical protein
MPMRIAYGEKDLAGKVKSLGGNWDRQNKVWMLSMKYVQLLEIEHRIVTKKDKENNGKSGYI